MAGFFENRWDAFCKGIDLLGEGVINLSKGLFGREPTSESSPGVAGAVIEMVRAPIEALFDEDKGLLNPKKGLDLNFLEDKSAWNLMNLFRKAIGGVVNTVSTIINKPIGIFSPKIGNNLDKIFKGVANSTLGIFTGDLSLYIGQEEGAGEENGPAANDNSYKQVESPPPDTKSSEAESQAAVAA